VALAHKGLLRHGENITNLLKLLSQLHAWMTHSSLSLHFICMKSLAGNLERYCLPFCFQKSTFDDGIRISQQFTD
jgi:hypothetical protein